MLRALGCTSALLGLLVLAWDASGAAAPPAPAAASDSGRGTLLGPRDRVPGEYLVTVPPGGDEALVRRVFEAFGVRSVSRVSEGLFLVRLTADPGPEVARRTGLASGEVRDVQPNFVYRRQRP